MDNDYPVGKNKPPKNRQFKKGQSGNPAGRGKGVKNLKTILKEELNRPLQVPGERGAIETLPAGRVLMRTLMIDGLKKNVSATRVILDMAFKTGLLAEEPQEVKTERLTPLALTTMQSFLDQMRDEED